MTTKGWALLARWLLPATLLLACLNTPPTAPIPARRSAPTPEPSGAAPPELVIAGPPADAAVPETTAPADGAIHVSTVPQLLQAIGSDRVVHVEPGVYDISTGSGISTPHVSWAGVHDGKELVIRGVKNLTLRGAADARPELVAQPRYAWVLRFAGAENVALENLILGHTPAGGCTGGVVGFEQSRDVRVEGCDLFGSGTIGLGLRDVTRSRFVHSTIRECTYGIAQIERSSEVIFRDARFADNGQYDLIEVTAARGVRFEQCTFTGNHTIKGGGHFFFKIAADASVEVDNPTFEKNSFDQLANDKSRLAITGGSGALQKALVRPSMEFNQIYTLTRYQRWLVAGTQVGVVFWDTTAHQVERLVKTDGGVGGLQVRGVHLWAGAWHGVLRFDGTRSKTYLQGTGASGTRLLTDTRGDLVVHQEKLVQVPNHWWRYDAQGDRFVPIAGAGPRQAPATLGGGNYHIFYDALVRKNGEVWGIDFLQQLLLTKAGNTSSIARQGPVYSGRDPRRLFEDPRGRLWVTDFASGFFLYDDAQRLFHQDPNVAAKASDLAVDVQRNRTWLLHYTDGLYVVEQGRTRFIDLRRLQYMRALMLDADGSVWVGGWNAIVHVLPQSPGGFAMDDFIVDASTLKPGAAAAAP